MRLTKTAVDKITPPDKGQAFYRDDTIKGFALRITAGGTKSFVVEKRIQGKVKRKTLGRYGEITVEQGRKEAQKFLGQVATGIDPIAKKRDSNAKNITLAEAFEDYLKVRSGLKASTIHDYRRVMKEGFGDWQDRPLRNISKDAVAKRHAKLGERSPSRANNAMRVLRAVFNFAEGQYEDSQGRSLFPENPVSRLSHTRAWYKVDRRHTVIKRSDLPTWYEAVNYLKTGTSEPQPHAVADYLLLLLFTGMRRGEGMRLRWEHIDEADRSFMLPDTKNREPLKLPLSDFVYELLMSRKAVVEGSPFVFPGEGESGHLQEPRPQIKKVIERSGIDFTLHDLRRTFVTVADGLDISYSALKRLVNHKTGNDVTEGYIISGVERLRSPMQRVTDFLKVQMGIAKASNVVSISKAKR
ncbi:integrase [bacterium endosymbiont of Escarpia laminata]|nr:MAG: integrase [bacterium endosymbiont of Escarpia laminata]